MGIIGNDWTRATLFSVGDVDFQFYQVFAIVTTLCQIVTAFQYAIGIIQTRSKPLPDGIYAEPFIWSDFLQQVVGFFAAYFAIIALGLVGQNPIIYNNSPKG
jgi:hypothetical protein